MEKYKFVEKIGTGSHGTVYLLEAMDPGKTRKVVCKSVLGKFKKQAEREVRLLSSLSHKRIIGIAEAVLDRASTFIILEYANYGNLESAIRYLAQNGRRATNYLIWSVLAQISDALLYLHNSRIIHRDIKPSNILINRFFVGSEEILEFKVCDFSLARRIGEREDKVMGHVVGTPFYMAPEMVSKREYNTSIDVWGLGVSLYELAVLKRPFAGESRKELYDAIRFDEIDPEAVCSDRALSELICRCMSRENRISIQSISRIDKIRLHLAFIELKLRELRIQELERQVGALERKSKWSQAPD
jgi:serine/threonine protein kinase